MATMGAGQPIDKGAGEGRGQSVTGIGFPLLDYSRCPKTTMVVWDGDGKDGHWHRKGRATTLAELFLAFGEKHTAYEIFFWYLHAEKLCLKRPHSWGSPDVRNAAHTRKRTYGHWGHRDGGRR